MARRNLSIALTLGLLLPVSVFAACGGDDGVTIPPDSDSGADAAHDTTVIPESGADVFMAPDVHEGGGGRDGSRDAPGDTGRDAPVDTGADTGADAGVDTGTDAGVDTGTDAGADTGTDAGADVGVDTGVDAGVDTGIDAGQDTGSPPQDASYDVTVFDGGACNTLANSGTYVVETRVPADPPAPQGGTIALGLYYMTAWDVYTGPGGLSGPTGNQRQTAFYFWASTYLKVTQDLGISVGENDNRNWGINPTDSKLLDSLQVCPLPLNMLSSNFTAGNGQLVLIAGQTVYTFTHQ